MKRIISLLMAVCLMVAICVPTATASGVSDDPIKIVNHSRSISASQIAEIKESVGANLVMNDGTEVAIPSVVTIEDIPTGGISTYSLSSERQYAVSVEAAASTNKTVTDSGDQNFSGIHVSATLNMVWTDGPGLDNVIYSITGTKKITEGKETWGKVQWGDGWKSALTWTQRDVSGTGEFHYWPGVTVSCPKAQYSILMDGAPWTLVLTVSSSVLQ